jgi:threonine dehydratase
VRRDLGEGRAADAARGRGRPGIHPDVEAAAAVIAGRLTRTPLLSSETLGRAFGGRAFLKAELLQKTGSFKPRGVLTKLASLTPQERSRGVIAASAGNHAGALAYASALEGIDCLVVMWQGASETKRAAAIGYGATVDQEAPGPTEVFERLAELVKETGRVFVHPFDDPLVVAGQGTVGREIGEDLPDVEVVVVPVGGGGLVSGVACALPGRRIVAVEPEGSAAFAAGLAAGESVPVRPESIADGLNAPFAGSLPLELGRELGIEPLLVTEEEIEEGFRFLYERAKLAVEPAGAAGVAALLAGRIPGLEGSTVAVVVSGGNVAGEMASGILKPDPRQADHEDRHPS